ncbi:hypothetical protein OWR29_47630 [Actinoplanes sp. Pm04-4]|uniref:Uncharacterized protein n=1 Tax=Paractinoplanes pyxinae TaxID=2997416 RepID=A0ABT4BIR1_9ACTN|nr:hypothetical protein [Actinoplanes pyxinae]MCY1145720.1 hypothetical protein [Actinoplanes pyxinae]
MPMIIFIDICVSLRSTRAAGMSMAMSSSCFWLASPALTSSGRRLTRRAGRDGAMLRFMDEDDHCWQQEEGDAEVALSAAILIGSAARPGMHNASSEGETTRRDAVSNQAETAGCGCPETVDLHRSQTPARRKQLMDTRQRLLEERDDKLKVRERLIQEWERVVA